MARKTTHTTEPPHLVGKLPAGTRHQPRGEMQTLKESEWLDICYLRDMSPPKVVVGVEILVRLALHEEDEQSWVDDILDHAREFGAAEITKRVTLIGGK